jgi:hypothetical protein
VVRIRKTATSTSWSTTKTIRVWFYGVAGVQVQFYINDTACNGGWVTLKDGAQDITFDVTNITRTAVTSYAVYVRPNSVTSNFTIYIDDIRYHTAITPYYTSGNVTFNQINTGNNDVSHVFFYPFDGILVSTAIVYKISLDGGITWHTVTDNEINKWVAISSWEESFVNKRNIQLKAEFSTSDTTKTAALDDFLLMYKLS